MHKTGMLGIQKTLAKYKDKLIEYGYKILLVRFTVWIGISLDLNAN